MNILERVMERWRPRRQRYALALAGGGVIGGMYEVGVIAAIEQRLNGGGSFDIYVGCSAGSVVASLLANGARARAPDPGHRPRPSAARGVRSQRAPGRADQRGRRGVFGDSRIFRALH